MSVARAATWLLGLVALAVAALALWPEADADDPPEAAASSSAASDDAVARGAYLARVGHCAGCHTARGGAPYAGGRGLPTPFGTVFAGNLTPDPDTGLGRWSGADFWRALHHGRGRDGRALVPAFPYTEFTHVTREDSDALWAYLRTLAPVRQANRPHALQFPFGTQAALRVWRRLHFRAAVPDAPAAPGRDLAWQRGAYLVRGLGHCAACHAPRDLLGATVQADRLAGGAMPMQPWFAPSLAPPAGADLVAWRAALFDLLRSGQSPHGTASGPMAEVVRGSTQHWSEADLAAAATFLASLPPQPPAEPAAPIAAEQRTRGAEIYADRCAKCHGEQGEGAPGAYPPLAGNPTVTLPDPGNALQVLRHGGFGPSTATIPRPYGMPPGGLTPQETADVLSFIRQAWGQQAPAVPVQAATRAP